MKHTGLSRRISGLPWHISDLFNTLFVHVNHVFRYEFQLEMIYRERYYYQTPKLMSQATFYGGNHKRSFSLLDRI